MVAAVVAEVADFVRELGRQRIHAHVQRPAVLVLRIGPVGGAARSIGLGGAQGDLVVDAFAVRPNPFTSGLLGLGDERAALASLGAGFDPAATQVVDGTCPKDPNNATDDENRRLYELGVQVHLASGDVGGATDLLVAYEIDGRQAMTSIPFGIWLCTATCP